MAAIALQALQVDPGGDPPSTERVRWYITTDRGDVQQATRDYGYKQLPAGAYTLYMGTFISARQITMLLDTESYQPVNDEDKLGEPIERGTRAKIFRMLCTYASML
jgi:hypothetical protein